MSGNSAFSRRQTVPIVRSCSLLAVAVMVGFAPSSLRSSREERQPVLADLELVAVRELGRVDALPVHEGAVQAPLVLDEPAPLALLEQRVLARDRDVVEEDPAVRRAADRRLAALRRERLARAAPARPDDERRPGEAEVLEGLERLVGVRGLERLRLLDVLALPFVEERAALRAVVRGLRVLEAALRTVDVAHQSLGGAAFPARISVSDSTSTWSRTLRPSVFCRRATSSARRMSILPCRIRRRYETSCSSFVYSSIRCFRSSSDMFARSGSGSTGTFRSEGQARL